MREFNEGNGSGKLTELTFSSSRRLDIIDDGIYTA